MSAPAPIPGGVATTIPELLLGAAARHRDRVALIDRHRRWTFVELLDAADRTAEALRAVGARPGCVVAASLPNDGQ
ncbi:MAG TPA: AMP-binding protein, partial [Acidimicrobiales bacterium]|nr:AMP-binding protein [Acidimicrobiales bacterium]